MQVNDTVRFNGKISTCRDIREVNSASKPAPKTQLPQRRDFDTRHSRIPWSVGCDHSLELVDLHVYFALVSDVWTGNVSRKPTRWIAQCAETSQSTVVNSLKRLQSAGHIEINKPARRGGKATYTLLSPVFGERDSIVNGKMTKVQNLRSARKPKPCGKCNGTGSHVGSSGICQNCLDAFMVAQSAKLG